VNTCPSCAAENPATAGVCEGCGSPLQGASDPPTHPAGAMAALLVDEAGELFEQRRFEEARKALSEALDIDRFDARARKLQWSVHLALESERAERDPEGALGAVGREIEQRLMGGELREAASLLQAAQAIHGDQPRLHDLRARIEILEVQQREAVMGMADALVVEGERLCMDREFEAAESALREALELDPMNIAAAKLLGDVCDLKAAAAPGLEEDFTPPHPVRPPAARPAAPPPVQAAPVAAPVLEEPAPRPAPPEPRFLTQQPTPGGGGRWIWLAAGALGLAALVALAFCRPG
jgi:tetratricopeptide (TPR) repeat protein